jgi:hypothetical protein
VQNVHVGNNVAKSFVKKNNLSQQRCAKDSTQNTFTAGQK